LSPQLQENAMNHLIRRSLVAGLLLAALAAPVAAEPPSRSTSPH